MDRNTQLNEALIDIYNLCYPCAEDDSEYIACELAYEIMWRIQELEYLNNTIEFTTDGKLYNKRFFDKGGKLVL